MADSQTQQEPQNVLIDKADIQEALVLSILSEITLTFKGFDFNTQKFRFSYINNESQETKTQIMDLELKEVTEPNPNYNNNLPTSGTNQPTLTYKVGVYTFTEEWLNQFYTTAFNGTSANLNIELFHLNAQFLQVVDNTIFVAFQDKPIVTPIQGLLPLPFANPFADIGIRAAVPQETPQGSDELSWKSGYTEPYQRPTNRDGKWIKMGQYNQILYDISKSALTLQDNISILAEYINNEIDVKIDGVNDKLGEVINTPPAGAVLLKGNQNVAGLKNFTSVNINNFKNSPQAVANLEWCMGFPITGVRDYFDFVIGTSYTCTFKTGAIYLYNFYREGYMNVIINSKKIYNTGGYNNLYSQNATSTTPWKNKDVISFEQSEEYDLGLWYVGS